jgi:GDP-L-fucose synthase
MNILVTGGNGLVGKAMQKIQDEYIFDDYQFVFPTRQDYDLLNMLQVESMMTDLKPDWVIHLAANVGGLYKNMHHKVQMLEDNLLMNYNILRASHNHGVQNFIGYLSTCIFPDGQHHPIDETMLHAGAPHNSNDAYAHAKRMLEIHCNAYNQMHDRNYNCIIPTNVYGPHDNYNLDDSHVIPGLIHRCFLAKRDNIPFEVRGTGKVWRQFIHADDLARATLQLMDKLDQDNVIVAGDEENEITIKDIAYMIAAEFDYTDYIEFNDKYSDGQYRKTADNSKLMQMLPDTKFVDINIGLKETIKHFIKNYDTIRK